MLPILRGKRTMIKKEIHNQELNVFRVKILNNTSFRPYQSKLRKIEKKKKNIYPNCYNIKKYHSQIFRLNKKQKKT